MMNEFTQTAVIETLSKLRDECYQNSERKGFWGEEEQTFYHADGTTRIVKTKPWNFGEKIALLHSELSEMFEAWRCNKGDTEKNINVLDSQSNSPDLQRRMTAIEEEMADVFIRLLDLCGKLNIDPGRVILAKMVYNEKRSHMHGGRKC